MTSVRIADAGERVLHRRLHNQLLSPTRRLEPHEIVSHLGAVQAQDYSGAKWALALRGTALRDSGIERSFNDGAILRTHVLRPTWHFVAPADIRWMLALTAPRIRQAMASQLRALDLGERDCIRAARTIERTLRDGRHQTRAELGQTLQRARFPLGGQRLTYLLAYAELEGVVCSGPRRGRQMTYALLEERVSPARSRARDESLAELAARYFGSHGPATTADFAWWSGLTVADAKRAIEMIASLLVRAAAGGHTYWDWRTRSTARRQPDTSHLLPAWDEYVIAYTNRELMLPANIASGRGPREVVFSNTIAINGRLAGTWRRIAGQRRVVVEVNRAGSWRAADNGLLSRAVEKYAAFLELPVTLALR